MIQIQSIVTLKKVKMSINLEIETLTDACNYAEREKNTINLVYRKKPKGLYEN